MGRFVVIVVDSCGAGALPDAAAYGDAGANTLGNCARVVGGLKVPHLQEWGLGNITSIAGCPPAPPRSGGWRKSRRARTPPPATGR